MQIKTRHVEEKISNFLLDTSKTVQPFAEFEIVVIIITYFDFLT